MKYDLSPEDIKELKDWTKKSVVDSQRALGLGVRVPGLPSAADDSRKLRRLRGGHETTLEKKMRSLETALKCQHDLAA